MAESHLADSGLLEDRLKKMVVEALRLKMDPASIDSEAPLFGAGLGLDSIDALELIVAIEKNFGVALDNQSEGERVLQSIRTLAEFLKSRGKD